MARDEVSDYKPNRNWMFVINNYTDEDLDAVRMFHDYSQLSVVYMCYGLELAPTTGTPHVQGYVRFKNPVRLSTLSAKLSRTTFKACSSRVNTPWYNYQYCSKTRSTDPEPNEVFWEWGVRPLEKPNHAGSASMTCILSYINLYFILEGGEANKTRWEGIRTLCKEGNMEEVEAEAYIKYYSTLKRIAAESVIIPRELESGSQIGYWYYGDTGAGKSYSAIKEFPDAYRKIANNKWWCSYAGEENVIIDDLDKTHAYMGYHLKIWADRYVFKAEIKGGSMDIRPTRICVTSNYHPKDIWTDSSTLNPILRRFKVVRFLTLTNVFNPGSEDEERQPWINEELIPSPVML